MPAPTRVIATMHLLVVKPTASMTISKIDNKMKLQDKNKNEGEKYRIF